MLIYAAQRESLNLSTNHASILKNISKKMSYNITIVPLILMMLSYLFLFILTLYYNNKIIWCALFITIVILTIYYIVSFFMKQICNLRTLNDINTTLNNESINEIKLYTALSYESEQPLNNLLEYYAIIIELFSYKGIEFIIFNSLINPQNLIMKNTISLNDIQLLKTKARNIIELYNSITNSHSNSISDMISVVNNAINNLDTNNIMTILNNHDNINIIADQYNLTNTHTTTSKWMQSIISYMQCLTSDKWISSIMQLTNSYDNKLTNTLYSQIVSQLQKLFNININNQKILNIIMNGSANNILNLLDIIQKNPQIMNNESSILLINDIIKKYNINNSNVSALFNVLENNYDVASIINDIYIY